VSGAVAVAARARKITIVLVAAVAENGVIGRAGGLPWRMKSDMAHFRSVTLDKPVVMGRKTFLSIGKLLPQRTNIVISRDAAFASAGVLVAPDLERALEAARGDALRRGADAIAIIGGTEIFRQALPRADRLEITSVHARPDGDTHFPPIDAKVWREAERREKTAGPQDDADFAFITYMRVTERAL
jgi:dihydrofolate reductase